MKRNAMANTKILEKKKWVDNTGGTGNEMNGTRYQAHCVEILRRVKNHNII